MVHITIERWDINGEALDAELRAALGNTFVGISTGPLGVTVHLADGAYPAHINLARGIVQAHDAAVLTPSQQARIERTQKLEQARLENTSELDTSAYNGQDALIQKLARKTAWLEQETLAQRGL